MWFAAENVVLMGNPYVLKGSSPFAEYVICRGKCGFNGESICFMGNSLSGMIQLTGDCPSANENGKMPLLNTQVWVEENKLLHENYRKPMANPLTMLAMSAMPSKMKRTVLTQEVVRIRRNISLELPWETTVKHLNDFSQRMRASGYGDIMKVTGTFNEPLDRQIMERVQISNFKGPVLMNRRNEMGGVRVERMQYRRWGGNS